MRNFERLSISLDSELVADINFMLMKTEGKVDPKNSYGKFFYEVLRPIVPHRNAENTEEDPNQ